MPKYPPQHPIIEHPQPTFLPQCDRPSFTPTQNNRLNKHLKWRRQKNEYRISVGGTNFLWSGQLE
jgi:hypothetical protein